LPSRQPDQRLQRLCRHARRRAKKAGESDDRLFSVAAWRDTPYFTDAERAALALTEAVTRLNDREDPIPTRSGTKLRSTTTKRRSPRCWFPLASANLAPSSVPLLPGTCEPPH